MTGNAALQCQIHPFGSLNDLRFVVVCSFYQGKLLLSRHKERQSWETQGGHIEAGETPLEAAKRELYEESGVSKAELLELCDYYGYDESGGANGTVFVAKVEELGTLPNTEMAECRLFERLPDNLTYPLVSPKLLQRALHKLMVDAALQAGFAQAAVLPTAEIVFDPSFRPFCEENICGKYGVNYACPPDCGSPEEMKERVLHYSHALVVESSWNIPDWRDAAAVKAGKRSHNEWQLQLKQQFTAWGHPGLMAGASGCSLCPTCAIVEGQPCRDPERKYSCLSAYCIYVKALADRCGMNYEYKEGRLSFYGIYAFD